ncbi:MAG TPA: M67 family metallopeptidase [Pyrinomonadaceae bacterium]|nr:M67 family metallopeptidase [Pyrinomonadaceae bacterium]
MLTITANQRRQIFTFAREAAPNECCGLIGGTIEGVARSIHPLTNVARNPHTAYEAAPEDLFASQRQMREQGEQLLAIYHSHPRAIEPEPSQTDRRLAYYPQAVYLIIGLGGATPVMRGFKIIESEGRWEAVEYAIADE